jgi:pyruvate/2-oxoacid:ferredoxin oxidoreductase alpha subunit
MQEGISYLAGAELPCVIVDVMRGGPGLGNIAPEQSDYFAMVKGGGHGDYHNLVVAPASVQEMADLTMLAFELADKYRNPAVVLCDGFVGQMVEPLDLAYEGEALLPPKPWAIKGTPETRENLVNSFFLEANQLEEHHRQLEAKYARAQQEEARYEVFRAEDAEVLLVGFGMVSRVLRSAVEELRNYGVRAGLFRPITLWPFPSKALAEVAARANHVLVVELNNGQMVEDVRLAVNDKAPVEFYGRTGGNAPSVEEIHSQVMALAGTAAYAPGRGRR